METTSHCEKTLNNKQNASRVIGHINSEQNKINVQTASTNANCPATQKERGKKREEKPNRTREWQSSKEE
jgi:hypothetical protein